jgi:NAD(P)-dependent dehydrogenase (short-subunit alcohol dehydrogenase family)
MRVNVAGPSAVRARGDPAHVDQDWRQGRRDRECVVARRAHRLANAFIDYAASKGALDTMTIGLAAETADCGIRVNACGPA